jgi:hypothetical protein
VGQELKLLPYNREDPTLKTRLTWAWTAALCALPTLASAQSGAPSGHALRIDQFKDLTLTDWALIYVVLASAFVIVLFFAAGAEAKPKAKEEDKK